MSTQWGEGSALAWLRLWRTPGLGPRAFQRILERYPDPASFLEASREEQAQLGLPQGVLEGLAQVDEAGVDADLRWLEGEGHHLLRCTEPDYPESLRRIGVPPPLLFVAGDPAVLSRPQLAVIGSRNPTPGGADNAHEFAAHLARAGLVVTSGLALGIDAAAHRGALAGEGSTVAVLGTGPDRVYPARHRKLAHEITECGVLVTELPVGIGVRREHFPRRNRIISGLALGTLVVEASPYSGSLITVQHALEQGREVFAIPGSIHNPLARGCHALIRQGAKLVDSAADILEELPALSIAAYEQPVDPLDGGKGLLDHAQKRLLAALGHDPVPMDVLLQRTGLTPDTLYSKLLQLEFMGYITVCPGGRYARAGDWA